MFYFNIYNDTWKRCYLIDVLYQIDTIFVLKQRLSLRTPAERLKFKLLRIKVVDMKFYHYIHEPKLDPFFRVVIYIFGVVINTLITTPKCVNTYSISLSISLGCVINTIYIYIYENRFFIRESYPEISTIPLIVPSLHYAIVGVGLNACSDSSHDFCLFQYIGQSYRGN